MFDSAHRNWTIAVLCLVVIGISVLTGLIQPQRIQDQVREFKEYTETPRTVSLTVGRKDMELAQKKDQTVEIFIDSREEKTAAVNLSLSFDPKVVTIKDITPGTYFENPDTLFKEIDNTDGRAIVAMGTLSPKAGSGPVVVLTLTGVAKGETEIKFLPETAAAAIGRRGNVLQSSEGVKVVVK